MFPTLKTWAFFYFSPDLSPQNHTSRRQNTDGSCTFISVGFSPSATHDGSILTVAKAMRDEGVQTLERCGSVGPV